MKTNAARSIPVSAAASVSLAESVRTAVGAGAQEKAEPMRALLQTGYGNADVLRMGTTARPKAGEGEVVLRVHAAGVDRGTWHMMTGRPYLMRLMGFGFSAPKNPVPGLDLSGTVVEAGAGVTRFRVGDVVFGFGQGSFAEYARASVDKLAHAPKSVSLDDAGVLAVSGITALQAVDAANVKAADRVLVIGATGGVGTYVVQIARALGADVTAVCSAAKADVLFKLGLSADRVIDYRTADFADGRVRYDVVIDIGGNTPLKRLRRAMTPTGTLVFVGGENGGDWTAGFERQIGAAILQRFVKQRFVMLASREHFSFLERLAALCDAGQVKPVIERRVTLDTIPDVLRDMEAGRVRGKVAVMIGTA
jgi:NADPH:quinone reductase-like Zn-dependent oxidoreductase